MFMRNATPPNNAATPKAAVCAGTPAVTGAVGVGLKAGGKPEPVALGEAVLLAGLRTLFKG